MTTNSFHPGTEDLPIDRSHGTLPASTVGEMDRALDDLTTSAPRWASLDIASRIDILDALRHDFGRVARRWVEACLEAEHIPAANPSAGEEWVAGPYLVLRNIRLLQQALQQVREQGHPQIPGPVTIRDDGQVVAQVFPEGIYDRIFYPPGMTAEVWMEPGVSADELSLTQATAYQAGADRTGAVALVLGAGNVSSIGPMDALYKLFVDNEVVIYKVHPVNDYLGPLMAEGFAALVEAGYLRLVYGGAEEGSYLCRHPQVDTIHVTGSDRTVEAIAFGPGAEGAQRKADRRPILTKPISSELGNVSPVIVVPGPWSHGDIEYHAENLVSMLANNAGFNCNAARVIIQHEGWGQRDELLQAVRKIFAELPTRNAFYPGAAERLDRFACAHPESTRQFGEDSLGRLPWTFITDLDPAADDEICYSTEAFTSVFVETSIGADSPAAFLDRAVEFANQRLWGTLSASILIHPESLRDPETAAAFERAVADLRYGTVTINQWAAMGYGLVVTPWGAFPGHDLYDIQSGTGVVHNTMMFSRAQKAVVRVPFRVRPKPPWFVSHQTAHELGSKLTEFETDPSPAKLPAILWEALRG